MTVATGLIVGVDASRNRSGGAKAYLIGILTEFDSVKYGIREVHVWAFRSLLDQIPNFPWLIKHNPEALECSLMRQLLWQASSLSEELKVARCDILFTTDASTLCLFKPTVVLSQDLLSYEPGMMTHYGFGLARLRLFVILLLQNFAFRRADGVIFLTRYVANIIQKSCGPLPFYVCIPHGVDSAFKQTQRKSIWPACGGRSIRCIYVSNTEMYKYQWVVVEAIWQLRLRGHNLSLKLVGGGRGNAQKLLEESITRFDPNREFVEQLDFLPKEVLPTLLIESDLFLFASGCETFGITLLEGMTVGLPIACSDRSSLPETLRDGGIYFDPEEVDSIASAIEKLIMSPALRLAVSYRARALSQQYSWKRCADETWAFITESYMRARK